VVGNRAPLGEDGATAGLTMHALAFVALLHGPTLDMVAVVVARVEFLQDVGLRLRLRRVGDARQRNVTPAHVLPLDDDPLDF